MTDFEAYQEYIQRKHNAFCKAVIRYAARDKILPTSAGNGERQISLDYLMDEKFGPVCRAGAGRGISFYRLRPDRPCSATRLLPPRSPHCRSRRRK